MRTYAHRSRVHIERGLLPRVHELSRVHREFVADYGLRSHGYLPGGEGSEGISHALVAEQYALPGQLIVGTDSHTPHSGALGCLAFGVGTTDIANSMITGAVRITVPEVLRIEFSGTLPCGVTAKDIVLHLLALPGLKAGTGVGKVFEFGGFGIAQLNTDERATLTNMTAKLGGFTGIVEPDAETVRFLKERRGIDVTIEPWMRSDEGATYAEVIRTDLSALSPMVAAPGDLGNGLDLSNLPQRVAIAIAYGGCGACANWGPGTSTNTDQVTVSAINRNFPGRSGPGRVWLASPPTVAASAIAGELTSFEELQARFDTGLGR
ncbi:aconitase family protein [Microvirga sp. 2TAF3]|uniref:aconitase family protein n=1 Tax=Microvirga sp. 2TAF3 TaxID=3233014 RepID=UPI003F94ED5A